MANTLTLNKFDMRSINFKPGSTGKGPVIVLIGRRDTGKSFLIKDLLYYHQDIPAGTVISGTEAGNGFYGPMVPQMFIYGEYNTSIVDNVLRRQKAVMQQMKAASSGGGPVPDHRCFLIMDDCLYDSTWARDVLMRMLFMNGRHWGIMLVITMQYPLGIPPILRTNIDYVFILREPTTSNRKRIYENYAGMFSTFEYFCQVMDECTANHECLVINNNSDSNQLQDMVFWYKAASHPSFRLGSDEFWEWSAKHEREMASANAPNFRKRGSGPIVEVKKKG